MAITYDGQLTVLVLFKVALGETHQQWYMCNMNIKTLDVEPVTAQLQKVLCNPADAARVHDVHCHCDQSVQFAV